MRPVGPAPAWPPRRGLGLPSALRPETALAVLDAGEAYGPPVLVAMRLPGAPPSAPGSQVPPLFRELVARGRRAPRRATRRARAPAASSARAGAPARGARGRARPRRRGARPHVQRRDHARARAARARARFARGGRAAQPPRGGARPAPTRDARVRSPGRRPRSRSCSPACSTAPAPRPRPRPPRSPRSPPPPSRSRSSRPACRYPGGVRSPEDLWALVASGGDAISMFPTDRGWDLDGLYDPDPGPTGTLLRADGGFLDDADRLRRRVLRHQPARGARDGSAAAAAAGGRLGGLRARRPPTRRRCAAADTGVVRRAHVPRLRHADAGRSATTSRATSGTGTPGSVASGRIAYTLGLAGPAVTVDTACSSSLVAMHLACQALRARECSLALAGGVTVMATPARSSSSAASAGCRPTGRCKPFGAGADGTGWSEGAGHAAARAAVRRAPQTATACSASSAAPRSTRTAPRNGLTAPNGPGAAARHPPGARQRRAARPTTSTSVEAHGTGTRLGDPDRGRRRCSPPTAGAARPIARCGSARSSRTSATPRPPPASPASSRWCWRCGARTLPRTLHVDAP